MVADLADVESLIIKRFKAQVETPNTLDGFVDYPNMPFNKRAADLKTQKWCRVRVQPVTGSPRYLNAGKVNRVRGQLVIQCFTPPNEGWEVGNTFAWAVLRSFAGKQADGIEYHANTAPIPVGISEGSYQINVVVPWLADETS